MEDPRSEREGKPTSRAEDSSRTSTKKEAAASPSSIDELPAEKACSVAAGCMQSPDSKCSDEKLLSKSQQKKRKRWERAMEHKAQRKKQQKEIKLAKAIAAGRDLDGERRSQEQRTKSGEGHTRREEKWLQRMKTADSSFQVCIDCAFGDQMTGKERGSLASQIRYCYSANRKSDNPVYLSVASLDGQVLEQLQKVEGFPDQWARRAFRSSEKSAVEMHGDKDRLVYLTSDSQNTLDHLDDAKIYVIGGIVDRNRLKRAAITKAETLGIATARLPIAEHLQLVTTKVLTTNHVFEILLKYRQLGNDWKAAMLGVLPNRKDARAKGETSEMQDLSTTNMK